MIPSFASTLSGGLFGQHNREPNPEDIKKENINPVALFKMAYLLDPVVRSSMFLYSWVLYLFVKLLKARFSLYRLASDSIFVNLFKIDQNRRFLVRMTYMGQILFFGTILCLFVDKYLSRGFTLAKKLIELTDLNGKVALVTGGYDGIGYETVLQLLKWRCKVVVLGRNKEKGEKALEKLRSTGTFDKDNVSFILADLDDLFTVKDAAYEFLRRHKRLDFLINNAGVYFRTPETTKFNMEKNFSSNFLGHFYLTNLLIGVIKKSEGRIINVSSIAHFRYDPAEDKLFTRKTTVGLNTGLLCNYYGRSKLFNIWFTHSLQRRLVAEESKAIAVCLAPGVIKTKMCWPIRGSTYCLVPRRFVPLILKRPVDGAATTLLLCAVPANLLLPGAYYAEGNLGVVSKYAHDTENEENLWNLADEMVDNIVK